MSSSVRAPHPQRRETDSRVEALINRLKPTGAPRASTLVTAASFIALLLWFTVTSRSAGQVGLLSTATYLGAFAVLGLLPGYALARLCLPGARTWLGMAGQAFGVGIPFTLATWAAAVTLGSGIGAWALAVLVLLAAALIPGWRRRLPFSPARRVNGLGAVVLAAAMMLQLRSFAAQLDVSRLLPASSPWYQDNYWHLAINGLLKTRLVPAYPQVLGEPLNYHWLANAHMAGMELATGLPNDMVLLRLWYFPMIVGAGLIAAGFVETSARRPYLGPFAGALVLLAPSLRLDNWTGLQGYGPWVANSPSQTFAVPVLLFAGALAARIVSKFRIRTLGLGFWILTAVVFLVAPGAKSSNLPLLLGGAVFALLVSLLVRELRPFRGGLAVMAGISAAALVATAPIFAGSGSGTAVQLGATIRRMAPWILSTGVNPYISDGLILPGITSAGRVLLLACILILFLGAFAWVMPGISALSPGKYPSDSSDPDAPSAQRRAVLWLLLGTGLAGLGATMVIDHDGLSQVYFMYGAIALLACFAVLGLDMLMTALRETDSTFGRQDGAPVLSDLVLYFAAVGGLVLGGALFFSRRLFSSTPGPERVPLLTAAEACGVLVVATVLVVAYMVLGRTAVWRNAITAGTAVLLLTAAAAPSVPALYGTPAPTDTVTVPGAALEAAAWVRDNTDPEAVVATNSHCLHERTPGGCDARSFWVSGVSERQAFIEGWAYTAAAHKAHGVNGQVYSRQPFSDEEAFAMNEKAITSADPEALAYLSDRGVDYLFAVTEISAVSGDLDSRADLVFSNEAVRVYKLR